MRIFNNIKWWIASVIFVVFSPIAILTGHTVNIDIAINKRIKKPFSFDSYGDDEDQYVKQEQRFSEKVSDMCMNYSDL